MGANRQVSRDVGKNGGFYYTIMFLRQTALSSDVGLKEALSSSHFLNQTMMS
jgi:hypothetical protein